MKKNMKKWIFLIAWMDGADIEGEEDTGVTDTSELIPQYLNGNKNIADFHFELPDNITEDQAWQFGAGAAFRENFTGSNTFSTIFEDK